jgi:hypothetical protein
MLKPLSILPSACRTPFAVFGAVLLAVVFVGCSSSKSGVLDDASLPTAFPNHRADHVRMFVDGRRDTVTAFKARASVTVTSPRRNARFGSSIDYRRADSLHLNIRATLGIEAARALVTPDSFFVYDRIKRRLYFGDIERADSMLPLPVSGPDVFYAMLGLSFTADDDWRMRADSAHYYFESPDRRMAITVDPRYWRVSHFIQYDADGEIVEERTYSDFDDIDGVVLARRVVLSRPQDATHASIYYTQMELNPTSLDLSLSVSDRTRRIRVK